MRIRFYSLCATLLILSFGRTQPVLGVPFTDGSTNFNNWTTNNYNIGNLFQDWNAPPYDNGISEGRVELVDSPTAFDGKSLQVLYPANKVGPADPPANPIGGSGAQWRWELFSTPQEYYNEVILEYKVMFPVGFQFVKGGKLPGLVGGTANTGGNVPDGTDGWSARMMWVGGGDVIQYVYHPDQPGTFGDTMTWNIGGQKSFTPGVWHTVRNRVVMNTPGQHDGIIQGWFDGELAMDRRAIRFRDNDSFGIDTMYFSSFYGGADLSWAPSSDQHVYFDDFLVTTSLGDFNTDFSVDGSDLSAWESGLGISSSAEFPDGDADRDGNVDGADFLVWQQEFSAGAGSLAAATVPEPSTRLLILLASLFTALIGRRWLAAGIVSRQTFTSLILSVAAVFLLGTNPTQAATFGDGNVEIWKDGNTAAATLTIDDNFLIDQAWWSATASTYNIPLTWFVITGNVGTGNIGVNGTWQAFQDRYAEGHDIQSHTVDHFPNFPASGPLPLETNYSQPITDIETNIQDSDVLTLAYPFGLQAPNDKTLAGQYYIAARGVTGILNTLTGVDYLNVNSLSTNNYGGGFPIPGVPGINPSHFAYIPKLVDQTKPEYQGWLSVHSHQMDTPKRDAITGLLNYLTATPGDFWVGQFTDVAQYAQERDDASLVTNVISPDEIQYTLTDNLDDTRYYEPLTVKVRVDNAWTQIVATQGGQPLSASLILDGGEQFALVNSVPDAGVVTLSEFVLDTNANFDGDGDIDGADFLTWQQGFGILSGALLSEGDADSNGTVNGADLAVWEGQFGPAALAAAVAVPEPTSATLLFCGLLALQFYYR